MASRDGKMAVDAANLASLLKRGYDACNGTNDEAVLPSEPTQVYTPRTPFNM